MVVSSSHKLRSFEYIYILLLILYAGRANTFFESGSIVENPIGFSLPIILSGILALKWRIVLNKQFYLLLFGFFIYFVAVTIKYGEFRPTIFLNYFLLFFIVYSTVKSLKFDLFIIYEQIIYYLAILGLIMWGMQTVLGGDTLYNYVSSIPSIDKFSYVSSDGLNILLYSIQPTASSLLYGIPIPRNCGYAWEPGAFAVYLCLAMFINLFIIKSEITRRNRFWIYLAALLSTQSTTGYLILLIILFFYFYNKDLNVFILLIPLIVIALVSLFSLPFMSNKIVEVFNQAGEVDMIVEESIIRGSSYSPGRFASFVIALEDFMNNPVLGLGTISEESWTYKVGASISSISGIGNLLAQFGIIGFIFFIILSIKSSFLFAKYFIYKGKVLLFLLIILISVSYSVIFMPLIMCIWMFSLFEPNVLKIKEKTDLRATISFKKNLINLDS